MLTNTFYEIKKSLDAKGMTKCNKQNRLLKINLLLPVAVVTVAVVTVAVVTTDVIAVVSVVVTLASVFVVVLLDQK